MTCNFNFCGIDMLCIDDVECFGIHCRHLEAEGCVVEYVGISGVMGEGYKTFEYPKWEEFNL